MDQLSLNADGDSVDFGFFEAEGTGSKSYGKNYSKIITRAVIEAEPREVSKIKQTNTRPTLKNLKVSAATKDNLVKNMITDSISSPTSSEEKRMLGNSIEDLTLFNCLAFSDDGNDDQPNFNADDKYFSDNSLSDSTVTTVTSDFTTVSHLSAMSDTSCGSDLSIDSSTPQNCDSVTNNDNAGNLTENIEEPSRPTSSESNGRYFKMRDDEYLTEKPINEFDHSIELNNHEDEHYRYDNDFEDQGNNSNTDRESDISSNKTDGSKTNTDIERRNIEVIENSNENQELSYSSLSRKASNSTIEDRLGDISLASQSSSNSNLAKSHYCRVQNKFRSKKKELNLTFSREELIKIERDNTILLKKIMAYSKPKSVSLNHMFSHKKTSAAINRARQQKRIEQDNYVLYSKINAMSRMKKVF